MCMIREWIGSYFQCGEVIRYDPPQKMSSERLC